MSIQQAGSSLPFRTPSGLSPVSGGLAALLWVTTVALVDSLESPGLRGAVAAFETDKMWAQVVVFGGGIVALVWFASLLGDRLVAVRSRVPTVSMASALLVTTASFGFFSLHLTGPPAFDALLAMAYFASAAFLLATGFAGFRSGEAPCLLAWICVVFGAGALVVWLIWTAQPLLVAWCLCASIMLLPHRSPIRA